MKFRIFLNATFLLSLCVCFSFFFSACIKTNLPSTNIPSSNTISGLIASANNLSVLDSALKKTHLDTLFSNESSFTYFVATNSAFASVGISTPVLNALPDSQLRKLLLYSALPAATFAAQFPLYPNVRFQTVSGDSVFITNNGSQIFVNGTPLVSDDVVASNGIIDAVPTPLLPPNGNLFQTAQLDTTFSYFVAAVNRTATAGINIGYYLTGNNIYTLFLPTNSAFRGAGYATIDSINNANPDSLSRILRYNILPGRLFTSDFINNQPETTLLSGSNVTIGLIGISSYGVLGNKNVTPAIIVSPNIMATNGVIHIIEQLLLP